MELVGLVAQHLQVVLVDLRVLVVRVVRVGRVVQVEHLCRVVLACQLLLVLLVILRVLVVRAVHSGKVYKVQVLEFRMGHLVVCPVFQEYLVHPVYQVFPIFLMDQVALVVPVNNIRHN